MERVGFAESVDFAQTIPDSCASIKVNDLLLIELNIGLLDSIQFVCIS